MAPDKKRPTSAVDAPKLKQTNRRRNLFQWGAIVFLLLASGLTSNILRFRQINVMLATRRTTFSERVESASEVTPPWIKKISIADDGDKDSGAVIEILDTSREQPKSDRPLVIVVTPTYPRPGQAIHVSQVVNVLRIVPPPLIWIVVESNEKSEETADLLKWTAGTCLQVSSNPQCTSINYTHLSSGVKHENKAQSRGVIQRNVALEYIESNRMEGIVYFMDDDNSYTPQLFQEIRKVKMVGVWPVGFFWSSEFKKVTKRAFNPYVERPLVKQLRSGRSVVIGWETFEWAAAMDPGRARKYQTDMAGFAFWSELLWKPTSMLTGRPRRPVRFHSRPMFIESMFLDRLVSDISELEPLANHCQDVNVWHTRLEADIGDAYPDRWRLRQPKKLVLDVHRNHSARYIVKGRRHYLLGHNGSLAFGYKKLGQLKSKL